MFYFRENNGEVGKLSKIEIEPAGHKSEYRNSEKY